MKVVNRRVHHEYTVLETLEAGIHLLGPEVKSVKGGRIVLEGAFIKLIGNEAYLVNAEIPPYAFARVENYDPRRTRKLLLHLREIIRLKTKISQSNLTLVAVSCYNKGRFIKLEIGLARGRKAFEKREKLKRRDIDRDVERQLREKR